MIRIDRRQILMGGLAAAIPWPALAAQRRKMSAFVVGINAYASLGKLTRAVNDARDIAARVADYGYDVTLSLDATTDGLLAAKREFLTALAENKGGASFCYFACHGVQIAGTNFLLPADVDSSSVDVMLESAIQFDDILKDIERTAPAQSVVVLDACRNDPAFAATAGQGFAATDVPNGCYVVYSAGSGELAVDDLGPEDRDRNGLFARNLLKHISPSDSFDEVIKRVKVEVSQSARKIGRRQHPGIFNQAVGDPRLVPTSTPTARSSAVPRLGQMNSTAILLVTGDDYPTDELARLTAPQADVASLKSLFQTLGVEAQILRNPDSRRLTEALQALAARNVDDLLIYYSGMGGLIDGDGFMFIPETRPPVAPFRTAKGADGKDKQGFSILTLASLLQVIAAASPPVEARGTVRGFALAGKKPGTARNQPKDLGKRVTLLMDTNLIDWGLALSDKAPESAITRLLGDRVIPGLDGVAVLYVAGMYQQAVDQAEGSIRGPMAIALANALARPGLTLAELSSVVRSEVEDITRGRQTPVLYANEGMRNLVLVEESPG